MKICSPYILYLFLLLWANTSKAQSIDFSKGAKGNGLGNATVAISDLWSAANNQSESVWINEAGIGVFYEQRFMIKELASKALVGMIPVGQNRITGAFSMIGYSGYNEITAGLGYAMKLSPRLSLAVQCDYLSVNTHDQEYNGHMYTFEISSSYRFNNAVNIAIHIFNPIGSTASGNGYIDSNMKVFRGGGGFVLSEYFKLFAELEYSNAYKTIGKVGLLIQATQKFEIHGGINTNPTQLSLGFGYKWAELHLDFYAQYHYVLGYTPGISLSYSISKKE